MQFPLSGLFGTSTRWRVRPAGRMHEKRRGVLRAVLSKSK